MLTSPALGSGSAGGSLTVTFTVACDVPLAGTGSIALSETDAVFTSFPSSVARATTETVASSFSAIEPRLHVVPSQLPWLAAIETSSSPEGSESDT